ncbi:MAG: hypothetical protein JO267_10035 [Alphaproteobacteria bacterium]|nr:hypothetical protein [Alphaproteobacteria bacterium]MBV9862472.1 hypothetical protein [Alphaproteobacteria bacterium]
MARPLNNDEHARVQHAIDDYVANLGAAGISLRLRRNFHNYVAVRHSYGETHLNQAFDPQHVRFGLHDFWVLAENRAGEPIATYCSRRFRVENFFDLIRSQALWFGDRPRLVDPRFIVECEIPPFGGEVLHGGGLWVRPDYRGATNLSAILPRFARAIALRNRPLDFDSGMIRNDPADPPRLADRKAAFMGVRAYGFARVHRFVDGWFPPEGRAAIMHLCHSTRSEVVGSLIPAPMRLAA